MVGQIHKDIVEPEHPKRLKELRALAVVTVGWEGNWYGVPRFSRIGMVSRDFGPRDFRSRDFRDLVSRDFCPAISLILTAYFLDHHVLAPHTRTLPAARERLVERLAALQGPRP